MSQTFWTALVSNINYINKIKVLQTLTTAYDSLQRQLKLSTDNSTKELHAANDSIIRLRSANKSETSKLYDKIRKLENDTASLNKQIKKLDVNNISSVQDKFIKK
jgi:predicted nuclease with TOPRIM domain